MKTIVGAVFAGFISMSTAVQAGDFSYTYIEGFYVHAEVDAGPVDEDGEGYRAGASLGLWEHLFLFARYQEFDLGGGIDTKLANYGGGVNIGLGALPIDLILRGGYLDAEVETPGGDIEDDGYSLGAALRIGLLSFLELEGGVDYFDLDDSGEGALIHALARLYVLPILALQAGAEFDDEMDNIQYLLGLRLEF